MKTKTIIEPRKSLSLKVVEDTLIIRRPKHVSPEFVDSFIEKKEPWIKAQLRLNKKFLIDPHRGMTLFNRFVEINTIKSRSKKIEKLKDKWIVYAASDATTIRLINDELKALLMNKIEQIIERLKLIKNFEVESIQIKNLTASWGNCRTNKQLGFAFRLVHMEESFIYSVVAHEVAHLFEMNHSPSFYRVLSQFDPNYHSSIKGLLDR